METPQESLDRLQHEVAQLRASRERLALAVDADRRRLERDLHDGLQQQLVALSVKLQLARGLVDADPATAKALLDELGAELQQALDETAKLAQGIYPPLLDARGLGVALRAAAATTGARVRIEVGNVGGATPEHVGAVYFCCREVLELAGLDARATIGVRIADGALVFEVREDELSYAVSTFDGVVDRLRDRVEALGGELTVQFDPGRGTHISGSLPLPR